MKKHLFLQGIIIALLLFSNGCKSKPDEIERAFYYWKSDPYSLNDQESLLLNKNKIQKLYVKFFEVDIDPTFGAISTSKTSLHLWKYTHGDSYNPSWSETINQLSIVPVIYIKNKVLFTATPGSLDSLADNISFLIVKRYNEQFKNREAYSEIQIDCDWTEKTSENYFYFLRKLKELSGKSISCTLRLYPFKYSDKMGVPPVDKAVLMCYNLKNPLESEGENSILSPEELKKYLIKNKEYPLHLDFALPVFSWMQVYQNNQFAGLINPGKEEAGEHLKPLKPLWYEVTKDWETENIFLRVGDKVKVEEVSAASIKESIKLLNKYVSIGPKHTVILFHLDDHNLNKFNNETISSFYTDFSN